MATLERPADRGTRLGRASLVRIGQDIRDARQDRGLSIAAVAKAVGLSPSEVSRIERGLVPGVSLLTLSRLAGVVGLDLVARSYPGAGPIRDAGQVKVLADFRHMLHRSIGFSTEVPVPIPGDQRAWDAVISGALRRAASGSPLTPGSLVASGSPSSGARWHYGVEAETSPRDAQALVRRNQLKLRDSNLDGFLVVLPDTRRARAFARAAFVELEAACPIPGRRALERLGAGLDPGGNAVILLARRRSVQPRI